MMVWGNGFFAKTMIPDHHAVQIPLIKRQQPLVKRELEDVITAKLLAQDILTIAKCRKNGAFS
ncbi:hypothetical protein XBFFR1_2560005 [Xenorhabdus bovienii str. feltiae France]|nr:hypothetical protein XBFFR1_2560005 [Xenorhabdus bovienii str. feltiae France]